MGSKSRSGGVLTDVSGPRRLGERERCSHVGPPEDPGGLELGRECFDAASASSGHRGNQ